MRPEQFVAAGAAVSSFAYGVAGRTGISLSRYQLLNSLYFRKEKRQKYQVIF